ncbi:MAG: HTTM domain-containing protein [Verrucomicrobiota bacterium]
MPAALAKGENPRGIDPNRRNRSHVPRTPFSRFAWIWAVTTLIHQLAFSFWMETWEGWITTFTAFLVILRPRCLVRFACLLVFSLTNLAHKLPFVPNHILFEGILNVTLLVGMAWGSWLRRPVDAFQRTRWSRIFRQMMPFLIAALIKAVFLIMTEDPRSHLMGGLTSVLLLFGIWKSLQFPAVEIREDAQILDHVAPVIRMEVILMYFWAVLQKLNADYFDSAVSCAAKLHQDMAELLPFVPEGEWASVAAIYGSLLCELGIPILFLIRQTRPIAFFVAILFHLWLSIHSAPGIYSFSALLFATFFFFLPNFAGPQIPRVWALQRKWLKERTGTLRWEPWIGPAVIVVFLLAAIWQGSLYLQHGRLRETFASANWIGFGLWAIWGIWMGSSYLWSLSRTCFLPQTYPSSLRISPLWIGLVLTMMNGLCPWIGLKTQTSFSMYSNLRTEWEGNHLFLERVDLFPFQSDLIQLVESEPDLLRLPERPTRIQAYANEGRWMPYFELRRLLSEHEGDIRLTYERGGEVHQVWRLRGKIVGNEHLFETIPWVPYHFLWFRRHLAPDGPMPCTH